VVLKWSLQRGVAVVTGTDNKEHMASDLDVWSFKLSDEELGVISALHKQ
jgi:diketogulonate reductase-like aldo/keto reductase